MVSATLHELDAWFNEAGLSLDRTNLLSKLATIELCGWIEEEFDRLIRTAASGRIRDADWVESDVIKNTFGFTYRRHWRTMLCKVAGELFACRIEDAMNAAYPTDLEQMTSLLGQLWKDRCSFAHADLNANKANTQITFNAPSVAIHQHNQLAKILARYEAVMSQVLPPP